MRLAAGLLVVVVGCHSKTDCEKFADQLADCRLSYGPVIMDTEGQAKARFEGYCDAAMQMSSEMKDVVTCVIAADGCEAVAACLY